MKTYIVKPELADLWILGGFIIDENQTIKETELEELSKEWDFPVDNLLEDLTEIKED